MRSISTIIISRNIIFSSCLTISLCFTGCRTIVDPPRAQLQSAATLDVVGSDGRERERHVETIAAGDERKALLKHHLQVMAQQSGPPLSANNEVKLLIDGPQTYDAIFSDLATAKSTIDIEMYIFDDDEIGSRLAETLKNKQRDGVRVRLIYDSVGCIKTPRKFFDDMRDMGIQVAEFNPVNPLAGKFLELNNRDHRKIIIVDSRVAYTGGINISSVYTHGSGFSRKNQARKNEQKNNEESAMAGGWRDTQIQVSGAAVPIFMELFESMWRESGGEAPPSNPHAATRASGDKYVRVIGSSPEDEVNYIYSDIFNAIENAQRSIHITMSYFSPNKQMVKALEAAAKRGVDVQIVLPGFSDWWPVLEAGRSHYDTLLDAGVRIYERHDVFLHAKTVVIDGIWSTVGSSNLDMRSFLHNREINVVILGNDFGEDMEAMFKTDRDQSEAIDREKWNQRSLLLRFKQSVSRIFSYWL